MQNHVITIKKELRNRLACISDSLMAGVNWTTEHFYDVRSS